MKSHRVHIPSLRGVDSKDVNDEAIPKKRLLRRAKALLAMTGWIGLFCYSSAFAQQQVDMKAQAESQMTQTKAGDGKISLDIKGMDIMDVLKMLALRSGKNIVAGKNVRGKVTVFLKDVDVMDALEIIIISNDLAYNMKGDIINVMTDREYEALYGEKFQDTKKLKVVRLKYGKAQEVSKALNQLKSRIGKLVVDEASNLLVIVDAPAIVSQMEELVRAMDMPTKTKVFALNYSKAETMKAKLEPLLTRGLGAIQIDERTNKVIVTDLESNMKTIETAVYEFDEKTKEVLIDAKILQITLDDEYKAGINWDAVFNGIKTQLGMNFNIITGTPIPTSAGGGQGSGGVHIGGLDTKYNAEAVIKFLEKYGKTNLLASPRIVTVNNEEAKILVGKNQPYATSQTTTPGTGAATTAYTVTFLDLGTKLYVTPTINRDGFITMKIKPEVSSTSANYTYGPNADTVPIVSTSQAETTVMVKDGSTIVIAGLIENREEEEVKKVPGLGNVPLVGGVFRSRTKGSSTNPEKNELVIFLTPHIITGEVSSLEVERYSGLTTKLERQLTQKEIRDISKDMETGLAKARPEEGNIRKDKEEIRKDEEKKAEGVKEAPKKQIGIDEYYNVVRELILEKVRENYPSESVGGEAHLSFCVSADGGLKGRPALLRTADPALKEAAIRSVEAAAPFPAFPAYFKKKEAMFKIVIIYE